MPRDARIDPVRREQPPVISNARDGVVSSPSRQTYRLVLVCHASDANAVQAELRIMFEKNGFARFSLQCEQARPMFLKLAATLESTIAERAALVRIVNQLTTMPSVRRLQWETVPNR